MVSHYKHSPFIKVEQPLNKGILWDIFEYLSLYNFSKPTLRVSFPSSQGLTRNWQPVPGEGQGLGVGRSKPRFCRGDEGQESMDKQTSTDTPVRG